MLNILTMLVCRIWIHMRLCIWIILYNNYQPYTKTNTKGSYTSRSKTTTITIPITTTTIKHVCKGIPNWSESFLLMPLFISILMCYKRYKGSYTQNKKCLFTFQKTQRRKENRSIWFRWSILVVVFVVTKRWFRWYHVRQICNWFCFFDWI